MSAAGARAPTPLSWMAGTRAAPERLGKDGRDAIAAALTVRGSVDRFGEIVVPLA
jgi:hypothetical protein